MSRIQICRTGVIIGKKNPRLITLLNNQKLELPGGRREKSDISKRAAAIRETQEEIGIRDIVLNGEVFSYQLPGFDVSIYTVESYKGLPFNNEPSKHERVVKLPLNGIDEFLEQKGYSLRRHAHFYLAIHDLVSKIYPS